MTWSGFKRSLSCALRDVFGHHNFQVAAALSYYCILAVFPGLIFLSAVMGTIPLPDLFGNVLVLMSHLLPSETMKVVRSVLTDVLATNRKTWLSVGMLGIVWVTSTAFDAMIEALDVAYDVKENRPFWKTRLLAVVLGAIAGTLLMASLSVMIVGPRFGAWLAARIPISHFFVLLWPAIHWMIAIGATVLAIEALYYLAPNVKQRFSATLPGAILTVTCWLGFSYLLGIYFRHFANYNRTYGTLGGVIALMTWFYWTAFALLVGAELNAELAKESEKGQLPAKEQPESLQRLNIAA